MTTLATPYLHEQALRARFAQHLKEALGATRITTEQHAWLQRLLETDPVTHETPLPRIDRLSSDAGIDLGSELDAAWVISDSLDPKAPLFLNTLLFGTEVFADRRALEQAITWRFLGGRAAALELERVEGNVFAQRSKAILEQEAARLQVLAECFDDLPDLQAAISHKLRDELARRLDLVNVDVSRHPLQLITDSPGEGPRVLGTQTLAEAAFEPLDNASVRRRFLNGQGWTVSEQEARAWDTALTGAASHLEQHFGNLLGAFWDDVPASGVSRRQRLQRALADAFRQLLITARTEQHLSELEFRRLRDLALQPGHATGQAWQIAVQLEDSLVVKLSGIFLLEPVSTELAGLYLVSPPHGVRRFVNRQQLQAHFQSAQGSDELLLHSSLNEHGALSRGRVGSLRLDLVEDPLFERQCESLIALQFRNLQHVLGLPVIASERAAVRVDDALDIRHLVDRRLLALHDGWRWSNDKGRFETRWTGGAGLPRGERLSIAELLTPPTWGGQMKRLDLLLQRQADLGEGAYGAMRLALNRYLAVFDNPALDARDLWLQIPGEGNVRLIDWALEHFTGHAPRALSSDVSVLHGGSERFVEPVGGLPVALIELIVAQTSAGFAGHYLQALRQFFSRSRRWLDTRLRLPALGGWIRECALRLDLAMATRLGALKPASLSMAGQVLERPLDAVRRSLGAERVEVCRLHVMYDPGQPALKLDEAIVLRGENPASGLVLWSLCEGFSEYASLSDLQQGLAKRLSLAEARAAWMAQLGGESRQRFQAYLDTVPGPAELVLTLQPVSGHFIEALQRDALELQCAGALRALHRAQAWQAAAPVLREALQPYEHDDANRQLLDRIGITMQVILADTRLPEWVKQASYAQLKDLRSIVLRWYLACHSDQDFLHDIPEPKVFAHARLLARLKGDFPDLDLDPDRIVVTLTRYTPAPVTLGEIPPSVPAATSQVQASLTDYAIERFAATQGALVSVLAGEGDPVDERLTIDYFSEMVRELDIAATYRQLLEAHFSPSGPEYAERLRLYAEQVPPLELLRGYSMRVTGRLSEEGYRFIEGVLDMPDGRSRLAVLDRQVIFSPLQISAGPGMQPDRVPGAFIIAPGAAQPGPWLLYMLFNADFVLQEYADEQALLDDIRGNAQLQKFILERLDSRGRRLYDHGGFLEPHIPFSTESDQDVPWQVPGPVTLVVEPVLGNALRTLFDSTGEVLRWWFDQSSVTNAEADRASTRFLWSLGAEQVLALLPGRLGALVGVWQSQHLLHESALDVISQRWGKAASELLAGLGLLIAVRRAREEEPIDPEPEPEQNGGEVASELPRVIGFPEFGWGNGRMTPELWGRLRPFQIHDVVLENLQHDELLNVYQGDDDRRYVRLAGAVYEVARDENSWYIFRDDSLGPRIVLDNQQQWQVDLRAGLKGGGGVLTRVSNGLIAAGVNRSMIVEARGMQEIRQRFRNRAQNIVDAHAQARQYLETCLDNLAFRDAAGARHPAVKAWVADFFGVAEPDAGLYAKVEQRVGVLYQELMDSTLSPWNSSRYVVGTRRHAGENTLAFTFPGEEQKRLYLTERFFMDPVCRLKPRVQSHGQFNLGAHFRAAILLHELSHLYCATEDIAYVESHMPFVDLLDDNSAYRRGLRDDMLVHQNGLSHRTPSDRLFHRHNEDGSWQDLGRSEGKALRKILDITGQKTLAGARVEFYANAEIRSDVMLANADTVALLVTQLGRRRLVPA
ncbi:hypothetical protein RRX38_07535 [Pseudomonas sp. DTU_2021_1001937_2_SI_NGA_ILE_001]|uniref:dermonecrotic toxin domain-containing protein n=1 Tax=Pseudomonas sp. DTU_2021_1001937_2_SI_NGA_ILE_001 TaxID=3077589 RepID=UPI0028FC2518|nr:DUF6543 domain-containing protein [Pseudomonas sp. DTU_2021_1001937_2_SI_NGA_ILE_001]WNW11012.1 hypothetical protein RRX38_07535 [Pseudomonas sp. DTU_2021_1001937_2_SI_NGA_ILE_001]